MPDELWGGRGRLFQVGCGVEGEVVPGGLCGGGRVRLFQVGCGGG